MNIEEVITNLRTVDQPDEVMHLRFIDNDDNVHYYESCDCWGEFLRIYNCPEYVNIPLLMGHDDSIIEWAMSTPLLSEVLMNKTVHSIRENGWILETGGLWSRWYTAGLFCRSFTEQFYKDLKHTEGVPAPVLYWAEIIANSNYSVPVVHGAFWSINLDYTKMFSLPKAVVNDREDRNLSFYTRNEVHSCRYMYTEDKDEVFRCICTPLYKGRKLYDWDNSETCTRISVSKEDVLDYLLKLYKEL